MKRRQFLKTSSYGLTGLALGSGLDLINGGADAIAQSGSNSQGLALGQSQATGQFSRNFVIPPLNTGKREGKHVHFDLNMQFGDTNFIGNATTPTLGIDGDFLGPVLRAQRGDTVSFAVKNKLDFNTTLH